MCAFGVIPFGFGFGVDEKRGTIFNVGTDNDLSSFHRPQKQNAMKKSVHWSDESVTHPNHSQSYRIDIRPRKIAFETECPTVVVAHINE